MESDENQETGDYVVIIIRHILNKYSYIKIIIITMFYIQWMGRRPSGLDVPSICHVVYVLLSRIHRNLVQGQLIYYYIYVYIYGRYEHLALHFCCVVHDQPSFRHNILHLSIIFHTHAQFPFGQHAVGHEQNMNDDSWLDRRHDDFRVSIQLSRLL